MGYSETLDRALSLTTSLGDVLRTTFILHYFKNDDVSWLVDGRAAPLLEGNPYIKNILIYSSNTLEPIKREAFDLVINLEKIPEACLFSDSLKAKRKVGFGLNGTSGKIDNYLDYLTGHKKLLEINKDIDKKRENQDCWQKILSEILEKEWRGQEYILGYRPKSDIKYDIGFNWTTSNKWSNKAWPDSHWKKLEDLVKEKYSISWQKGLANIFEYIDWINSCKLIVTADTLGLHICLALKKRVIAMFGPTSHREIYFYNCGKYLLSDAPYDCMPCLNPTCSQKKQCMAYIYPEKVKECIDYEFKKNSNS